MTAMSLSHSGKVCIAVKKSADDLGLASRYSARQSAAFFLSATFSGGNFDAMANRCTGKWLSSS